MPRRRALKIVFAGLAGSSIADFVPRPAAADIPSRCDTDGVPLCKVNKEGKCAQTTMPAHCGCTARWGKKYQCASFGGEGKEQCYCSNVDRELCSITAGGLCEDNGCKKHHGVCLSTIDGGTAVCICVPKHCPNGQTCK